MAPHPGGRGVGGFAALGGLAASDLRRFAVEHAFDRGLELREALALLDEGAEPEGTNVLPGDRCAAEEHDAAHDAVASQLFGEIHAVSVGEIDIEDPHGVSAG